jgi:hypothetical protein
MQSTTRRYLVPEGIKTFVYTPALTEAREDDLAGQSIESRLGKSFAKRLKIGRRKSGLRCRLAGSTGMHVFVL